MMAKGLELFGTRNLVAYDIGCDFSKTVTLTSLAHLFSDQEFRCCVNAFHGYSHNYLCQLRHHPNSIEGMGIEDLETLEHVFSASNALASITCYMSAYRRRIFIDLYFQQWDAEKYQNLVTMLHYNYRQALEIIETNSRDVQEVLHLKGLSENDLDTFISSKHQYFETLGKESEGDLHAIAYVELLEELKAVK